MPEASTTLARGPLRACRPAPARDRSPRFEADQHLPQRDGVKLLDFGLARATAASLDETAVTMPGMVMGSPRYMSPEQVRGEDVDARTDIFAAGLVLYEMLSGRAAFGGTSAVDLLHAVVHEHPPALMGLAGGGRHRLHHPAGGVEGASRIATSRPKKMATELRVSLSRAATCRRGGEARARPSGSWCCRSRCSGPIPTLDFLAFSLPDAIPVSLSALDSLPRALEPDRGAVCRGPAGFAGARLRARRPGGDHRHLAPRRQDGSGRGAADSGAPPARCDGRTPPRCRSTTSSRSRTRSVPWWSTRSR